MQDVTPEAVHRILSENPRGLCLYADELAGWFKNFNRYNNGSESEFWMSVFNHKVAMSDRKEQPERCLHPQSVPLRHRQRSSPKC